jgi:soluble lytic murein transglycosylase
MLNNIHQLKFLGLVGLLLGISCSYNPKMQNTSSCQNNPGQNIPKTLSLSNRQSSLKTDLNLNQTRELFKQAYTNFEQGNFSQAQTQWSTLADEYPELGDYVLHYLAQTEVALDQHAEAINNWLKLISQFPASCLIFNARLGMADSYFKLGNFSQAGTLYQQLADEEWQNKEDQPAIKQKLAQCYEQQADFKRAIAVYDSLWINYPTSDQAEAARQRSLFLEQEHSLPPLPLTEDALWRRICILIQGAKYNTAAQELARFKTLFPTSSLIPDTYLKQARCCLAQQKPAQAIKFLTELIRDFPRHKLAIEAKYKLARLYWNRGTDQKAVKYLQNILKERKALEWHHKAYYILGRIHEENRQYNKAIENFQQLANNFRHSNLVDIANWRLGWINYYYLKEYAKAAVFFGKVSLSTVEDTDLYYSARYWQGRCHEKLKEWDMADAQYISIIKQADNTFYALMASQRLSKLKLEHIAEPVSLLASTPQKELSLAADPFLIESLLSESDKFHLVRVKELAVLLMFEDALGELDKLAIPDNPPHEFFYHLSRLYHLLGDYPKAIRLIQLLIDRARKDNLAIPLEVWKMCYPLNYWPLIQKQAQLENLDPYLIVSVIRQESVFDPESLSRVSAMGLMQVIPDTGKTIARKLKLIGFSPDMLYDPETNLTLGSHYLAQLIRKFEGNLASALAAYNAGEKAAKKWCREHNSDDIALFSESISYPETRNYIKQVLKNYNNYQRIYQESKKAL